MKKTMLGGWEDVERCLAAERAGRTVATAAASSVSVRRCVPVTPPESARPAALWQSNSPRQTCLGGPAAPRHAAHPVSAPPCSRPARRQPPPLPMHLLPRGAANMPAAAQPLPLARLPLDATCELSDLDLILLPAPALQAERGARRAVARLEPTAPVRRGWLRRLRRWARRSLRALAA